MNKNTINFNFIPPYTPEANPIEQYFSSLKRNYRKIQNRDDLIETVIQAINNTNNDNLISYFNHSLKYIKNYQVINTVLDNDHI